ncbi:hypothetical protein EDC94DRAFT_599393 [Helicostylum pulchrum]|nr:hypothetical protein EDC94DRAFT_599393 [Helicostylum pulchrum]
MSNQLPNSNDPAVHDTDHTFLEYIAFDALYQQHLASYHMQRVIATEVEPIISQSYPPSHFLRDDEILFPQQNQFFDLNAYTSVDFQESSGESSNNSLSSSPSFSFSQSRQSTPDSDYYSPPPPPAPAPPAPTRRRREATGATRSRRSNPITRHSCPRCNDTFSCLKDVIIHILSHSDNQNDGSHPCPLCDSSYSRGQDVKRHLLSHFAIRNERCSRCPKTFKRHDSLIRHQRKCL